MAASVYNAGSRKEPLPKNKKEAPVEKKPSIFEWVPLNMPGKQLGLQVTARTAKDRRELMDKTEDIPTD